MVQQPFIDVVKQALDTAYGYNLQRLAATTKGGPPVSSLRDPKQLVEVNIIEATHSLEIEFVSSNLAPQISNAVAMLGSGLSYYVVFEGELAGSDKDELQNVLDSNYKENIIVLDGFDIENLLDPLKKPYAPTPEAPIEQPTEDRLEIAAQFLDSPLFDERGFYLVATKWNGEERVAPFLDLHVWEYDLDIDSQEIIKGVQKGDLLFMRGTDETLKMRHLFIKGVGVVTNNPDNGTSLSVDWFLRDFGVNIYDMIAHLEPIEQIDGIDVQTVLSHLSDQQLTAIDEQLASLPAPLNKLTIAGLISDTDSGTDHLDITKDVSAFSRVIAARSFVPPLAIALFGKWGSGKSFFMRKLSEQIEVLAGQNSNGLFCKGIAQVHFNAWSYMDSNLWASMVSRIFEGLQLYIGNYKLASAEKREVEKNLTNKLNITNEALEILEQEKQIVNGKLTTLENDKKKLQDQIDARIAEIKEETLISTLEKVDELFNVEGKVKDAFLNNPTVQWNEAEFKRIVPQRYWSNIEDVYQRTESTSTFVKVFFDKNKWGRNVLWALAIIAIIVIVPFAISFISEKIGTTNLKLPVEAWSIITVLGGIGVRAINAYNKIQPLAASFWEIRKEYAVEVETATQDYLQHQKALEIEIENFRREIETLDVQIGATKQERDEIEFRIKNTLSTEALYSFIERKSESKDYAKHLGIVSTIRKDFEILSELFTDHNSEAKKIKAEDIVAFKRYFKHPLERIILYIDDLDRCPEERVVEVLEAVNLLMAYPLFVVVVGVDPRWIKNALYKRHKLQFTGLEEKDEIDLITPSAYLEKIFQVPFNLKRASDTSVKFMLKTLAETKPLLKSKLELIEATGGHKQPPSNEGDGSTKKPIPPDQPPNLGPEVGSPETPNHPPEQTEQPVITMESLTFSKVEIAQIQAMSEVVGSSPRAIKRFINIFRIVKAHEDYPNNMPLVELKAVLFLLALPLGKFKEHYGAFIDGMSKAAQELTGIEFFIDYYGEHNGANNPANNFASLLVRLFSEDEGDSFMVDFPEFQKHYPLIKRFSYVSQ